MTERRPGSHNKRTGRIPQGYGAISAEDFRATNVQPPPEGTWRTIEGKEVDPELIVRPENSQRTASTPLRRETQTLFTPEPKGVPTLAEIDKMVKNMGK